MSHEEHQREHHHHDHGHHGNGDVFIHIDHKKYDLKQHRLTGAQLRNVADPHIGPDYDLWLETKGPGDDDKIGDDKEVHLRSGMSFYSVLRQINPGASDATA